jgi:hypothetical protein
VSGVVEGLTREVIRQRVGDNLPNFFLGTTTSLSGTADSVTDNKAYGGENDWRGTWIRFYDGTLDGEVSRVSAFDGAGNYTVAPAFSTFVPSLASYERWDPKYHPERIDRFINQAISSVIGKFYKSEESLALHGDGKTTRFDIPSEFDSIHKIEIREGHRDIEIHGCNTTFDETTDADFTQALDTEDRKQGNSLKLTVAAGASAGDFITDNISSKDLSKYTHLEGWVKSNVVLDAADYVIRLDNGVVQGDSSDLEILSLPAVSVDTWTFFRIALANPESDTAIISIGIEMNVDKGAHVIYFDDIRCVDNNSGKWSPLNRILYDFDDEARDLVFKCPVGNYLMKIHGGSNPAQMTADSDVATVPEEKLIRKATSLAFRAASREENDWEWRQAQHWEGMADEVRLRLPANTRRIA